jgi:hypothetical protein
VSPSEVARFLLFVAWTAWNGVSNVTTFDTTPRARDSSPAAGSTGAGKQLNADASITGQ